MLEVAVFLIRGGVLLIWIQSKCNYELSFSKKLISNFGKSSIPALVSKFLLWWLFCGFGFFNLLTF